MLLPSSVVGPAVEAAHEVLPVVSPRAVRTGRHVDQLATAVLADIVERLDAPGPLPQVRITMMESSQIL